MKKLVWVLLVLPLSLQAEYQRTAPTGRVKARRDVPSRGVDPLPSSGSKLHDQIGNVFIKPEEHKQLIKEALAEAAKADPKNPYKPFEQKVNGLTALQQAAKTDINVFKAYFENDPRSQETKNADVLAMSEYYAGRIAGYLQDKATKTAKGEKTDLEDRNIPYMYELMANLRGAVPEALAKKLREGDAKAFYRHFLYRDAKPNEIEHWAGEIKKAADAGKDIAGSQEGLEKAPKAAAIRREYFAKVGEEPSLEKMIEYMQGIEKPGRLNEVLEGIQKLSTKEKE